MHSVTTRARAPERNSRVGKSGRELDRYALADCCCTTPVRLSTGVIYVDCELFGPGRESRLFIELSAHWDERGICYLLPLF